MGNCARWHCSVTFGVAVFLSAGNFSLEGREEARSVCVCVCVCVMGMKGIGGGEEASGFPD